MSDERVNHPAHYGGDTVYEVIKVCEAWGLDQDAYLFNTIKYVGRPGKGNYLEDLKKARFYLDRRIQQMEEASQELLAEDLEPEPVKCADWGAEQQGRVLSAQESNQQPTHVQVTMLPKAVSGAPGEFWVLRADNAVTANSSWHTFNTSSLFIDHRARAVIREELLGLIGRFPPSEFDKLAPQVQEAVTDWLYVQDARQN